MSTSLFFLNIIAMIVLWFLAIRVISKRNVFDTILVFCVIVLFAIASLVAGL